MCFLQSQALQPLPNLKDQNMQAGIFSRVDLWWNLRQCLVIALNLELQGYFQKINGMLLS